MDLGLPAKLGVHRLDAQAIGFLAAVAAALAHRLVDEDPQGRIEGLSPLPLAPQVRGALLVVDQRGNSGRVPQQALGLVQPIPGPDLHPIR